MDEGKNHSFLIDVFNNYSKLNKEAVLILIGDGKLKEDIKKKISILNLENKVLLLGVKDNVNELYSVFDSFLFPSLFEGLGIVLIEAQANGVETLASNYVPTSSKISNRIKYLELDIDLWVRQITKISRKRKHTIYNLRKKDYEISSVTNKLTDLYNKASVE